MMKKKKKFVIREHSENTAKTHIKKFYISSVFFSSSSVCSFSKFIFHICFVLCFFNNIITIEFSFLCFNKSGRSSIAATPHIFYENLFSFTWNENLNIFLSEIPKEHCVYNMRTICNTKMHESWILHRSDIV